MSRAAPVAPASAISRAAPVAPATLPVIPGSGGGGRRRVKRVRRVSYLVLNSGDSLVGVRQGLPNRSLFQLNCHMFCP